VQSFRGEMSRKGDVDGLPWQPTLTAYPDRLPLPQPLRAQVSAVTWHKPTLQQLHGKLVLCMLSDWQLDACILLLRTHQEHFAYLRPLHAESCWVHRAMAGSGTPFCLPLFLGVFFLGLYSCCTAQSQSVHNYTCDASTSYSSLLSSSNRHYLQ